jgi:hypothetical protein
MKVAGTTTEVFFKKYCIDPNKISLFESQLQQNKSNDNFKFPSESQYGIVNNGGNYGITYPQFNKPHMTCEEIIRGIEADDRLGEEIWEEYTKITNVRNPWDLVVSRFHWELKKDKPNWVKTIGFEKFVKHQATLDNAKSNRKIWTYKNQFDFEYIRFENLEEDILKVCKKVGINVKNVNLENYKQISRKPYQEYYNEETKRIVGKAYKKEIELFNYKF